MSEWAPDSTTCSSYGSDILLAYYNCNTLIINYICLKNSGGYDHCSMIKNELIINILQRILRIQTTWNEARWELQSNTVKYEGSPKVLERNSVQCYIQITAAFQILFKVLKWDDLMSYISLWCINTPFIYKPLKSTCPWVHSNNAV